MDPMKRSVLVRAVYEEHMRAYHEYIDMPNYFFQFWKNRKKDRLGYYIDGLDEWQKRMRYE